MVGQLPFQSFLQLGNLPAQLPLGQIGELVRIGLPFDQPLNHGPAGDAHHVAGHRGQLDVGIFQDFLNAIDGACLFFHHLRPVPREVSQLALRTRGNKAAFQQSALQQLRDQARLYSGLHAPRGIGLRPAQADPDHKPISTAFSCFAGVAKGHD